MSGTRFLYNGNVIDYTDGYVEPPPPASRASRADAVRQRIERAGRQRTTIADNIREILPSLAYGAGMLTGDDERAAAWDAAVRDATGDATASVASLPGMDTEYSPVAVAMNAVPFSDDLLGIATAISEDVPMSDTMGAFERARHRATVENPGSALVGGLAQGVMLGASPLPFLGAATGSTRAAQIANQLAPAALLGMGLGAAGGYLETPEDASTEERIRNTAVGGVTGGGVGLGAAGLGAAGQAVRTVASARPLLAGLGRIAGAGLTGAGYGVASAPDASSAPIHDPRAIALDALRSGGYGLGAGLALGTGAEALGTIPRLIQSGQRYLQGALGDVPAPTGTPGAVPGIDDIDEARVLLGDDAPAPATPSLAGIDTPIATLDEQLRAARAGTTPESATDAMTLLGLRQDPTTTRLHSIGISGPEAQARVGATFGGPQGFVEAARQFDLLPEHGVYDPTAMHREFERVRDLSARQLAVRRQPVRESGATFSGSTIADELEAAAARHEAVTGPRGLARAQALRSLANEYRYGRGFDTGTAAAGVEPPAPRELTLNEIMADLDDWAEQNSRAWRNPGVRQPSEEVGLDVYGALSRARDALTRRELSPEDFADYQRALLGYRVGVTGAPHGVPPRQDAARYGDLRGWMGAMTAASGPFGVVAAPFGFAASRLLSRYQPSIMATLNEGALRPTGETIANVSRAVIESAANSGAPVRIPAAAASTLGNAASGNIDDIGRALGAIDEVIRAARQASPQAAQAIERAVQPLRQQQQWGAVLRTVTRLARSNPERWGAIAQRIEGAADLASRAAIINNAVASDQSLLRDLQSNVSTEIISGIEDAERGAMEAQRDELLREVGAAPMDAGQQPEQAPEPGSIEEAEMRAMEEQRRELLEMLGGGAP